MRRIFPKIFLLLFFALIFIFIQKSQVLAFSSVTSFPEDVIQPTSVGSNDLEWSSVINENTQTVQIDFSDLDPSINYKACLKSNPKDCEGGDNLKDIDVNNPIFVCGDGNNLKIAKDDDRCGDRDYFHPQRIYTVSLFNSEISTTSLETASFYVGFYYPEIEITSDKPVPGQPFTVTLKGTRRPHKNANRNNYLIELKDAENSKLEMFCVRVHDDWKNEVKYQQNADPDLGTVSFAVPAGDYVLYIKDQDNEVEGFFHIKPDFNNADCAARGFVYYRVDIKVREGGGSIEIIADPKGKDLSKQPIYYKSPSDPCKVDPLTGEGSCPTGLGIRINTAPGEFVTSVLSLILSLSGGIAIILIIISGYRMIASQGNPEKLEEARQQLVSAIVGLLFLIFSLVILQVIGVDILKLDVLSGGAFGT